MGISRVIFAHFCVSCFWTTPGPGRAKWSGFCWGQGDEVGKEAYNPVCVSFRQFPPRSNQAPETISNCFQKWLLSFWVPSELFCSGFKKRQHFQTLKWGQVVGRRGVSQVPTWNSCRCLRWEFGRIVPCNWGEGGIGHEKMVASLVFGENVQKRDKVRHVTTFDCYRIFGPKPESTVVY